MMLLQSKPGVVVRLNDPAATLGLRTVVSVNPRILFNVEKSILTKVSVDSSVNIQFLHALGRHVYVYIFGDRMGMIGLSGLSFSRVCGDDSEDPGASRMYEWYKTYRASRRQTPLTVSIGRTVFEGFMVRFGETVVEPDTQLFEWRAELASLPEDDALPGQADTPVVVGPQRPRPGPEPRAIAE